MSEAVEHDNRRYREMLRWWDGCAAGITVPAALFIAYGYVCGALDGWSAVLLLVVVVVLAVGQNFVYLDLYARCPETAGGTAGYAYAGWRTRFSLVGPLATYGYWFACSSAAAIYGLQVGNLIRAQWFPNVTWTVSTGIATIGVPHLIVVGVLLAVWVCNVVGIKPSRRIVYGIGMLTLIPIIASIALHFDLSTRGHPVWGDSVVWMFVLIWVVNGVEAGSMDVPPFRDTMWDNKIGPRLVAVVLIALYFVVPLGVGGLVAEDASASTPVEFYVSAFRTLLGGVSWLLTSCLIVGLILLMMLTAASSGSVLHGSAGDGLTVRELAQTNRFHVPDRAMILALVVNTILIMFVGEALVIIVAAILVYLLCHIFALSGYLNLRRDTPDPTGPGESSRWRPWIAWSLVVIDIVFVIGMAAVGGTGDGGEREVLVAALVLTLSVGLYLVRRVVQDNEPFRWRDGKPHPHDAAKGNL